MQLSEDLRLLFDRLLEPWVGGIIAGGAVRDGLLGYPINDIDLWAQGNKPGPWKDLDFSEQENAAEYSMQDDCVRVTGCGAWTGTKTKPADCRYPVQVMPIERVDWGREPIAPAELCRRFDYGACMAAYTRQDGLYLSIEFHADVAAKRFTLRNGRFTNMARYERLFKKFSGWRVDKPDPDRRQRRQAQDDWDNLIEQGAPF